MKNECSIIRDILPLYVENMVSEDTSEFVKEHLESCPACRAELEKLREPVEVQTAPQPECAPPDGRAGTDRPPDSENPA